MEKSLPIPNGPCIGSMGRREGHEGKRGEGKGEAHTGRPTDRKQKQKSKYQSDEMTIRGKIVRDIAKKEDIEDVADTDTERGKQRKKDRVEIMIRVGGKRGEILASEEGAEGGKGELVEEEERVKGREEGRICQDCRRKGMMATKEREEELRQEKKMEAREESMMLNLNLPSTPTLVQPDPPRWQRARSDEDWSLQEDKIVKNLRFSLEQLRLVGDEVSYMDLVEKLVMGPAPLKASQMEQLLGINPDLVSRATSISSSTSRPGERRSGKEKNRKGAESKDLDLKELRRGNQDTRVDLLDQFQMFSKFGDSTSDGSQITLTQSDRWLRQAKVIDGGNVTTTDTAIAFRKISRGSIRLSYTSWRQFVQEISDRADLSMMEVGKANKDVWRRRYASFFVALLLRLFLVFFFWEVNHYTHE